MKLRRCSRQSDLGAAVRAGQWPDGCDPELLAHVADCRSCSDFGLVTHAFQQARTAASLQAPLGSPGALWWSAQVRRHNRAVERMSLPIILVEVIALVSAIAALAFSLWRWSQNWLPSITDLFPGSPDLSTTPGWPMLLVVAASFTLLLLGSVAVYLITHKE